ncbi:MAG: hypothetical protein RI894_737, partial [Bacteroidota bacterium]
MIKITSNYWIASIVLLLLCSLTPKDAIATNYYWRAAALSNIYTNVGNWETVPGGGVSPAIAPSINDNVFFPVASNFNVIVLNSGNCKDFNVTAPNPATFSFSGKLTAINGSLLCPNGNASFNFTSSQPFTGSGSQTIDIGTTATKVTGTLDFSTATTVGTYTLAGAFNTTALITIAAQNFNTNGFPMAATQIAISGATTKTVNFSNSVITILKSSTFQGRILFNSANATTTYTCTNTRIVVDNTSSTT